MKVEIFFIATKWVMLLQFFLISLFDQDANLIIHEYVSSIVGDCAAVKWKQSCRLNFSWIE